MNMKCLCKGLLVLGLVKSLSLNTVRANMDDFANPGNSLDKAGVVLTSTDRYEECGYAVVSAGDVDGDGLSDVLIDGGDCYLILGSSIMEGVGIDVASADYTLAYGGAYNTHNIASAGDVDGDGLSDVLIGSPHEGSSTSAGVTYLLLGRSLAGHSSLVTLSTEADYIFTGEAKYDYSGSAVAGAGDVDGDGLSDVLIGAVYNDDGGDRAGKVYLILGSSLPAGSGSVKLSDADYAFIGKDASGDFGAVLTGGRDVDGDGLSDILLSGYSNDPGAHLVDAGETYLFYGSTIISGDSSISAAEADYTFYGETAYDISGSSISFAGDVDRDGHADILIGAMGYGSAGRTYLILNSSLGSDRSIDLYEADYKFDGEASGDLCGHSVAGAGDVDGDGLFDILIGASGNSDDAGKSYLVLGASLGSDTSFDLSKADYIFEGEAKDDKSGSCVAGAGDVDGDGVSDILIGAPFNSDKGTETGKAYLMLSATCIPSDTIYVDCLYGSSYGSGSSNCPLDTITGGIAKANDLGITNVIALGGTYAEVVRLSSNLCLQGQLRSGIPAIISDPDHEPYLVYGADNASLKYCMLLGGGLCLSNQVQGMTVEENIVMCSSNDQAVVLVGYKDNILNNNVLLSRSTNNTQPVVFFEGNAKSNTLINNTMHRYSDKTNDSLSVVAFDFKSIGPNIFMNNILYASAPRKKIGLITAPYTNWYGFYSASIGASHSIRYNWTGPANHQVTVSTSLPGGSNLKSWDSPGFNSRWPSDTDYELSATSGCVNMGIPNTSYNDPDGTRNDMGAYGGPSALNFEP